jgi:hypothetical protein
MSLPEVVSRDEWLVARKGLLAEEKELTRRRDALNAERRRLPMVEVIKEYVFHGPEGEARLLDLFAGRRQLVVGHTSSCSTRAGRTAARAARRAPTRSRRACSTTCTRARPRSPTSPRAAGEDRALQGEEGLDLPLVLVARQRLQLRLPRHARRVGRAPRVQLPPLPGTGRLGAALRDAGDELLPARRRTASSTPTRRTPAAPSRPAAPTTGSISPSWVARRSGRSRRAGPRRRTPRARTSRPDRETRRAARATSRPGSAGGSRRRRGPVRARSPPRRSRR